MKRFQLIATALLLPLLGHGQAFVDDIYYSPGDEKVQAETPKAEPANYKNGAKEIVFIDSNSGEELYLDTDTIFLDNGLTEDETPYAEEQLAETDVQVAEAAGYTDLSTMYRAFRQFGDITPGALKASVRHRT